MQDLELGDVTEESESDLQLLRHTTEQGSNRTREAGAVKCTCYVPHEDYKINTTFIGIQQTETTACDSLVLQGHQYLISVLRALLEGISLRAHQNYVRFQPYLIKTLLI